MTTSDFHKPFAVQLSGSALARWLLARIGWRVQFDGLPTLQGVLVVYPHTSNWDFVVLVLVKWSIGIPVRFWGKHTLFQIPLLGSWLRWLGGVPVERASPQGVVGQAVEQFAHASERGEYFWLALAPEGTRKATPGWRSGFYQTAFKAQVPLGLVRLDYSRREVVVQDFILLTGDPAADFVRITAVYRSVQGCRPGNAAPIKLLDSSVSRAETILK
ncbi:MAG: 1-acyl-sn-glycerol-3-phosphate acyltransferase [Gammaproteobacteria bacterium]|nr:1-acyl-sn-glycerol-3-phosphate acyltransferase [Gammaproteobacteria bacterium]MBU0788768.1 1-acyl-sn-glycerol-3-phosphate acyltransferase [Gammaproteobacteria bacterium]MBU0814612.1 1-acyl-sn-glycerol-3-phosphate acyltransferase [Gammaproteobacteria bacterium]MBU1786545.1 1-acyl-sn-glycerol-3-phosphate acyltransferase [Gammaproteobacteria bacterium]